MNYHYHPLSLSLLLSSSSLLSRIIIIITHHSAQILHVNLHSVTFLSALTNSSPQGCIIRHYLRTIYIRMSTIVQTQNENISNAKYDILITNNTKQKCSVYNWASLYWDSNDIFLFIIFVPSEATDIKIAFIYRIFILLEWLLVENNLVNPSFITLTS